mmetsp:Transcript_28198/g.80098  ORF Transcript_28198/g.80098 Transcript_28198/m.80098 type:complete len:529 (-) Transcript_28198:67-1653(-)
MGAKNGTPMATAWRSGKAVILTKSFGSPRREGKPDGAAAQTFTDNPGKNISDHYTLEQKDIGRGTYGSVYKATSKSTGDIRAVKVIARAKMKNVDRFQREISILKMMDHPNIIRLYETFEAHKAIYLVMELASGGELFDRILEARHLSEATAGIVMQQIFRAVFYMHSNDVAHRDLKPENFLFLSKDPIEGNTLKLIDFGLACPCPPGCHLKSKIGTAIYMAPQVVMGRYDKMCDMWSVGVIMYILLSGRAPIIGASDRETVAKIREGRWVFEGSSWQQVSDDAKDLIKSCMRMCAKTRICAEAALHHAWINQTAPKTIDTQLGADVLERIRGFEASNKFKRAALEVVARRMDDDKIQELRELFEALDTNGDGQLSIAELTGGLERSGLDLGGIDVKSTIAIMDGDFSGSIDYTEFLMATLDRKAFLTEDVMWTAFNVFDQNGDGKISMHELRNVLKAANVSSAGALEAMRAVDSNGDGTVDFDEFMAMMRNGVGNNQVGKEEAGDDEAGIEGSEDSAEESGDIEGRE